MKKIEKTIDIGGKKLTLSTGHVALQASGAVLASCGETVALATVMASPLKADLGYFPLIVDYRERLSAGGRIKGSRWVKRDGRPTDDEILTSRLIDRSIRPLFPKDYKKEVQVIVQVLSVDMENPPDMIAAAAVAAAIEASSIPWYGPVGIVKVGLNDSKMVANPLHEELATSEMDLIVSTTSDAIVMIEAAANEVSEKQMIKGISLAEKEGKKLVSFITEFAKKVGKKKEVLPKVNANAAISKKIKELADKKLDDLIKALAIKEAGYDDLNELKKAVTDSFEEEDSKMVGGMFETLFTKKVRDMLVSGKRPDGRKSDELRELAAEVAVLPRVHGSTIFRRGQTQALTVATLGPPSLEQLIETAEGEEKKRYIHHYSMPPYSVGEAGRFGFPSRRDIGHGALAEKALFPMIPSKEEFPYTIHLVSEILSSNGSTSMAATCGSTLALMDAGVPLKSPVAGIAMGVVIEDKKTFKVLTDISGIEDGGGDMDFKVAGTKDGVTALQLDVKVLKLSLNILEKAFEQAKKARLEILGVMLKAIAKPREKVSQHAPKIRVITVEKEKIGEVIGPGGRTIKKIIAETGSQVEVDDEGRVSITASTEEDVNKAYQTVENIVKVPTPGEIYDGEVSRIQPFGAHVEIAPGKEGLVHVSDMSTEFVKDPGDFVKVGQKVQVKVKEVDRLGRLNLTMVLDADITAKPRRDRPQKRFDNRDRNRGGRGNYNNNRRPRSDRGSRPSGPHFPATRLLKEEK